MTKQKLYFYYALYSSVIILMVLALVWFRFIWLEKYSVKAYTSTIASFHASDKIDEYQLQTPLSQALVVHFVDHSCPCTQYSLPFIDELNREHAKQGKYLLVLRDSISQIKDSGIKRVAEDLPASPAVAIWNSEGNLAYFGSYSSGEYCGDGEDMVRYALDAMRKNKDFNWIDQEAQGCMCSWQDDSV